MAGTEVSAEDYSKAVFEDGGSLVIDLGGIQALTFEALPKGIYDAVLDEFTYGPSKSSNKPMFTAVWKVEGGDYDGRKLYQYYSFSEKAIRGTKAQLMRLDAEKFAGQFNPTAIAESGEMLGTRKKLKVTIQDGQNGEPSNSVNVQPDIQGTESGGIGGGNFFAG
jgi:hypothetical protein